MVWIPVIVCLQDHAKEFGYTGGNGRKIAGGAFEIILYAFLINLI